MSAPQQVLMAVAAAGAAVAISNQNSLHTAVIPGTATAGYRLANTGSALKAISGSYVAIANEWLRLGAAADYEAMAHKESGDTPTGTMDTWLALDTTRTWQLTTTSTDLDCVLTVSIRNASSMAVLATATITLHVGTTA